MNLYLISQSENIDYDTYDSAVVAAESEDIARNMDPGDGAQIDWTQVTYVWCSRPDQVKVKFLGTAASGTERGVICASFNAG